jgi:hypothetical protein
MADNPQVLGIAAGAALGGLLDALVEKGILSRAEVRNVLGNAHTALSPYRQMLGVSDASQYLSSLAQKFSES